MTVSTSLYEPPSFLERTIENGARIGTNCGQADKLNTLIKAAGIDDVEPIWTSLFAKVRTSHIIKMERSALVANDGDTGS